jgi:hypothetical protein
MFLVDTTWLWVERGMSPEVSNTVYFPGRSLDDLINDAHCLGLWRFNWVLMAFKPDTTRGHSLKLVSAWEKPITCPVVGCVAKFAEQKECNRHVRSLMPL